MCARSVCMCTRAYKSPHYIFIPVSRVFAGYLRQIVRLSGFAVPIFLKEALGKTSACSLVDVTENSFVRGAAVRYRLQNKSRDRYRGFANFAITTRVVMTRNRPRNKGEFTFYEELYLFNYDGH